MAFVYNAASIIFVVNHIGLGLGHLFKIPALYDPSLFYIDGKPGSGDTGIEKFFALVLGAWYTSVSLAMVLTFWSKSRSGLKSTLLSLLVYHTIITYAGVVVIPAWKILVHPELMPLYHGCLLLINIFLVIKV